MLQHLANLLPPDLQDQLKALLSTPGAKQAQSKTGDILKAAKFAVGPMIEDIGKLIKGLVTQGKAPTLDVLFKHVCVIGLNRSELLLQGESQPVFNENWQELVDDTMRRGLAMLFFAPRGLDGQPVNPYLFLATNGVEATTEADEEATMALAQQNLQGFALLDLCRMAPAAPNTVNILVAGDVLFHWDVKDNYILPTTSTSWVRDAEVVLKSYPRTTKANIYTQWDAELLHPTERISLFKLRDLPVDTSTWLNKPTAQEAYGTHLLVLSILMAIITGLGVWWQGSGLEGLNEELRIVEQQIPREGRLAELQKAITEQEKWLESRGVFFLAVKDMAHAIEASQMKMASFEVKVPDANEAPKQLVASVEAQKNAYQGWLQEEPVAKDILLSSAMLLGVRKPPAATFKIEGLISLKEQLKEYKRLFSNRALPQGKVVSSSTELLSRQDVSATLVTSETTKRPETEVEAPITLPTGGAEE